MHASDAPAPPWRLFLALWPGDAVAASLDRHAAGWQWPEAARRTATGYLHLTLHFIGDVPVADLPRLQAALPRGWEGGELLLDCAAVWRGGIVVLEAAQVPPALADLHDRLGRVLRGQGLPVEQRKLRPHVTLARRAQGARPPAAFEPLRWPLAPRYRLVRSLPGGGGYQPLQCLG
ncbi:MAG: 2'-5' RNA ligase family protein [Ramlibacter sp.]